MGVALGTIPQLRGRAAPAAWSGAAAPAVPADPALHAPGAELQRLLADKGNPSISRWNAAYMDANPQGTLSPGDLAFGESQLGRANELIGTGESQARAQAARGYAARGLSGSGGDLQSAADIGQGGAIARVGAARNVSDLLNTIREGNTNFERQKLFTSWGATLADQQQKKQQDAAKSSTMWNSIIGVAGKALPLAASIFSGGVIPPIPITPMTDFGGGGVNP